MNEPGLFSNNSSDRNSAPEPPSLRHLAGGALFAFVFACLGGGAAGAIFAPSFAKDFAMVLGLVYAAPLALLFAIAGAVVRSPPLMTTLAQVGVALAFGAVAAYLTHSEGQIIGALWFGQLAGGSAQLTLAVRRWRPPLEGHCRDCGYNLTGLPERRCPECGTPF